MAIPAGSDRSSPRLRLEDAARHLLLSGSRDVYITMGPSELQNEERDPDVAQQRLCDALGTARMKSGNQTLKQLAVQTSYSESMLSRVFAGKALPSFELLTKLAEIFGVEMSSFETVWLPLLRTAHGTAKQTKQAKAQQPPPAAAGGMPTGFECPSCGSWVVNPAKHMEWHMQFEPGRERPRLRLAE